MHVQAWSPWSPRPRTRPKVHARPGWSALDKSGGPGGPWQRDKVEEATLLEQGAGSELESWSVEHFVSLHAASPPVRVLEGATGHCSLWD